MSGTVSPAIVTPQSTSPLLPLGPRARAASIPLVFGAGNASGGVTVNLQALPPGQALGALATLYVDNSSNPLPATVTFPDTGAVIDVPAYTAGFWPAITGGELFIVAVPLLGFVAAESSGFLAPVTIQALNVPIPPASTMQPPANVLAGAAQNVGSGTWSTWSGNVPGVGLVMTAIQLNNTSADQITISSTDIFGNAWTLSQAPASSAELRIPPTLSGEPVTVATVSGTVGAPLAAVWRPIPAETDTNVVAITGSVVISSGTVNVGNVTIGAPLPAGSNTIGGVNVASALPAGANNIGGVQDHGNGPGDVSRPLYSTMKSVYTNVAYAGSAVSTNVSNAGNPGNFLEGFTLSGWFTASSAGQILVEILDYNTVIWAGYFPVTTTPGVPQTIVVPAMLYLAQHSNQYFVISIPAQAGVTGTLAVTLNHANTSQIGP